GAAMHTRCRTSPRVGSRGDIADSAGPTPRDGPRPTLRAPWTLCPPCLLSKAITSGLRGRFWAERFGSKAAVAGLQECLEAPRLHRRDELGPLCVVRSVRH